MLRGALWTPLIFFASGRLENASRVNTPSIGTLDGISRLHSGNYKGVNEIMMDVFEFVLTNEAHLAHRLSETAAHYSEWTQDRVFEETKRILDGLESNFNKENALISTINAEGIDDLVQEAQKHRDELRADAENLCMIHVDEPGFEQGLETLAYKFQRHKEFCENTLFPRLKESASPAELERVANQLDAVVLDG